MHSSILAWKIPWTEGPGGLQSMGLQRVGTTKQLTHTHTQGNQRHMHFSQWRQYINNLWSWFGQWVGEMGEMLVQGYKVSIIQDEYVLGVECMVQFSRSVMSNCLRPQRLQHARPPCPSPTPGVYSDSCPLSQGCHPTISSSVVPFPSHLQSFPASGSFPRSQFSSGGTRVSALASVLPLNIQDWFHLGWTGWISLQSKGFSRVSSNTTVENHQFFGTQFSL